MRLFAFMIRFMIVLIAAGCATSPHSTSQSTDLINPALGRVVAGAPGWEFERRVQGDFDRDGVQETAVLIANVSKRNGQLLWEDGQAWQLYIEEPDGARTYLVSRIVQLGRLELLAGTPGDGVTPLVVEQTPHVLAVYELRYRGPHNATAVELVRRELDASRVSAP